MSKATRVRGDVQDPEEQTYCTECWLVNQSVPQALAAQHCDASGSEFKSAELIHHPAIRTKLPSKEVDLTLLLGGVGLPYTVG